MLVKYKMRQHGQDTYGSWPSHFEHGRMRLAGLRLVLLINLFGGMAHDGCQGQSIRIENLKPMT